MADEQAIRNESEKNLKKIQEIELKNRKAGVKKIYGFLDFDGVINIYDEKRFEAYKDTPKEEAEFILADRPCIERLSDLCLQYHMVLIISSSWRYSGVGYCYEYLRRCGLKRGVIVGGTTELTILVRRQIQIEHYLLAHPDFCGYLVFDDIHMPDFKERMMLCDPQKGIDTELARRASDILRKMAG